MFNVKKRFKKSFQDALWCQTLYKNVFLKCPRTFESPCNYIHLFINYYMSLFNNYLSKLYRVIQRIFTDEGQGSIFKLRDCAQSISRIKITLEGSFLQKFFRYLDVKVTPFKILEIAKTCCQYGCEEIQLNQLCLAFSYKRQEADDGLKRFINKPLKL